jgi:2-oxo-3-hexenedioate decarboxylase
MAGAAGVTLEPGWIILAGSATTPHPLSAGTHVRHEVEGLGQVEFTAT